MPGPFTHIYTARRVADFLAATNPPQVTENFIRRKDGDLQREQQLKPDLLAQLDPAACAAAMNAWPKFTAVGAIGPDLFFWLQDYNNSDIPCDSIMLAMSLLYYLDDQGRLDDPYDGLVTILQEVIGDTWAAILRFVIKLDQLWQKFLKVWNATIGPIFDAAGQLADDATGGLLSALGDAFTELKNDILSLVEEELLTEGDIFAWFSLKMRKGFDEQAFVWSDMMHYRRTSVVPAQLISHARTMLESNDSLTKQHGEQLLAFALGWICHVGTDVIEHSFVNEQCGGPFRTHWQRHHLIENHIDAWNYQCTAPGNVNGTLPRDDFVAWQPSYPSVADSALYFAVQIPQNIDDPGVSAADQQGALRQPLPDGTDSASQAQRTELLDTDGALPLWLAETIYKVFIEVYAEPSEGGLQDLQNSVDEGPVPVPHPRNLQGQQFQDDLHASTTLIGYWLGKLNIDNVGMALDDLRKIIAPDPPAIPSATKPNVPVGFPSPWEIMTAYRFMLSWFKRQYVGNLDIPRPEPPKVFTPPASDTNFSGPPDFSGVSASDDPISDICGAVLAVLDWVTKTLEQVAQLLYDLAKTALSAATYPVREELYKLVTLPAWQAAENMRLVLVHLAYVMPQSEQLYDDGSGNVKIPNEIDESLVTLGHTVDSAFQSALAAALDPLGNLDKDPTLTNIGVREVLGAPNPWLPVRVAKGETPPTIAGLIAQAGSEDVDEFQRPWGFPDKNNDKDPNKAANFLETPLTYAGPFVTNTQPHELLQTSLPASNIARVYYEDAGCPTDTDLYTKSFVLHQTGLFGSDEFRGDNPLGDPVVFSTYLIGQIANNPSFVSKNFNLDADRGYGYLCWDWVRKDDNTKPKDGQGNVFISPTTWPEGTDPHDHTEWVRPDPMPYDQSTPRQYTTQKLELWYRGRSCKEGQPEVPK